jgi:hypothetical protein
MKTEANPRISHGREESTKKAGKFPRPLYRGESRKQRCCDEFIDFWDEALESEDEMLWGRDETFASAMSANACIHDPDGLGIFVIWIFRDSVFAAGR